MPQRLPTSHGEASAANSTPIRRAAELLAKAKAPLFFGLDDASLNAQRTALRLAERLGAFLDTPLSLVHGEGGWAFYDVGEATCTLGELRLRADHVLLWGCQLEQTHPRFIERFLQKEGVQIASVRGAQTEDYHSAGSSNAVPPLKFPEVQLAPQQRIAGLQIMLALQQGQKINDETAVAHTSQPTTYWQALLDFLREGAYSAVVFDTHALPSKFRRLEQQFVFELVRKLQDGGRCVAFELGAAGNLAGATQLLTWSTGYPYALSFANSQPFHAPPETCAKSLLERGACDVAVLVGTRRISQLGAAAIAALNQMPCIVIGCADVQSLAPTIQIASSPLAWYEPSTVFRMDGLALPITKRLNCDDPSLESILDEIGRLCP